MEQTLKPPLSLTMPLYAIARKNDALLDVMLEMGAEMDYDTKRNSVRQVLSEATNKIHEVHFKHKRWRRLRQLL